MHIKAYGKYKIKHKNCKQSKTRTWIIRDYALFSRKDTAFIDPTFHSSSAND